MPVGPGRGRGAGTRHQHLGQDRHFSALRISSAQRDRGAGPPDPARPSDERAVQPDHRAIASRVVSAQVPPRTRIPTGSHSRIDCSLLRVVDLRPGPGPDHDTRRTPVPATPPRRPLTRLPGTGGFEVEGAVADPHPRAVAVVGDGAVLLLARRGAVKRYARTPRASSAMCVRPEHQTTSARRAVSAQVAARSQPRPRPAAAPRARRLLCHTGADRSSLGRLCLGISRTTTGRVGPPLRNSTSSGRGPTGTSRRAVRSKPDRTGPCGRAPRSCSPRWNRSPNAGTPAPRSRTSPSGWA